MNPDLAKTRLMAQPDDWITVLHGTREVICLSARRIAWAAHWSDLVDTMMAAMELDEVSDPSRSRARIGLFQFLFVGVCLTI